MSDQPTRYHDQSRCADYDFRHHLYNTILLLGGKKDIADILKRSLDSNVCADDVDSIRNYNVELADQIKSRMAHLNTMRIRSAS